MKKFFSIIGLLLIVGIVFLSISGSKLQTVETEIDIAAPPEKVWSVLTNIGQWQDWNPTVNASLGDAAVGSTVTITMISEEAGKDGPKYSPEIIQMDEPTYFHWRATMGAGFIFTNEKIIELEKTDAGTKVKHTETFKGAMAALMKSRMQSGVSPILTAMNDALKKTAEQ